MTTTTPEAVPAGSEWRPLVDSDIGIMRRFFRGRRWYGAEWYITVFGALILVTVLLTTLLAPIIAPHDPNEFIGAPFTAPGHGLQALLVRKGESPIRAGDDLAGDHLAGKAIGTQRNKNGAVWTKEKGIERRRYNKQEEMIAALERGEVDIIFIGAEWLDGVLAANPGLEMVQKGIGRRYWLGTNNLGQDATSRLIWGARTILLVAVMSALFSSLVGIPLGLTSAFVGGKLDKVLSLVLDSIYSFPGLLLAVALAAMLGPSLINVTIAISVVYVPTFFRIVRGQVLSIKENTYIEAARSIGARPHTILFSYIFPNVMPSVVVLFSLNIADAILTSAGLTFIGLGLPPDIPDWGYDLNKGHQYVVAGHWWMITFPGIMITLVAAGFSLLGEGLSEILNPRLVKS
jgi:peptide/nickel transport system permease protein